MCTINNITFSGCALIPLAYRDRDYDKIAQLISRSRFFGPNRLYFSCRAYLSKNGLCFFWNSTYNSHRMHPSGQGHRTTSTSPHHPTLLNALKHTEELSKILVIPLFYSIIMDIPKDQLTDKVPKNKWRGVTILLRMGGQGHPTPIHIPCPPPRHTYTGTESILT